MEIFLLIGCIAGILAGLLGVGGGIVLVPILAWFFQTNSIIPDTNLMQVAIGTTLATIVITSISSIITHHQHKAVLWNIAWKLTPGIILGALFGAVIASILPSKFLYNFFAIFILFAAIQLAFNIYPTVHRKLPYQAVMSLVGTIIGLISALVGIGGGSMTVPFLVWCNISVRNAVATSAVCGFPIAVAGTIGFMITGWQTTGNLGTYIYWPAFIGIAPASLLFAPLGAKLAHTIPTAMLKKFFAIFLVAVSCKMLIGLNI
ncbi:sulfite exporter TauE/SafE family protein [Candidatus Halobeggiatoa sp. HSG11]|nr:sulfite exporter TauE/SafE family protein [Candidatus Halobeggiatoa sp. HSG11]